LTPKFFDSGDPGSSSSNNHNSNNETTTTTTTASSAVAAVASTLLSPVLGGGGGGGGNKTLEGGGDALEEAVAKEVGGCVGWLVVGWLLIAAIVKSLPFPTSYHLHPQKTKQTRHQRTHTHTHTHTHHKTHTQVLSLRLPQILTLLRHGGRLNAKKLTKQGLDASVVAQVLEAQVRWKA
jgi:hypothetical protein